MCDDRRFPFLLLLALAYGGPLKHQDLTFDKVGEASQQYHIFRLLDHLHVANFHVLSFHAHSIVLFFDWIAIPIVRRGDLYIISIG